jgi:hypothetical protein
MFRLSAILVTGPAVATHADPPAGLRVAGVVRHIEGGRATVILREVSGVAGRMFGDGD